ncbi:MAG TPA: 5-dehydro-2-deoxygluconokinase [Thermoleophilaceae bacterium]|nr:5-dehydro-2-deoxygluconokinase [Thermoleophilaceae bacterium]
MASFDVITVGRVSVDLYPQQIGVELPDVRSFTKSLGGSAANVAVATARLGTRATVITKVGDDPFGEYVRRSLREFGVDPRFVSTDSSLRTPLAFCEIHPPDYFPILFYRHPKAPDMTLGYDDLPIEQIVDCELFWTTGTGLSGEPSRTATLAALAARSRSARFAEHGRITVHDLDHRPALWESEEEARRMAGEAVRHATVVVGNTEEAEMATGRPDPLEASAALIDAGVQVAVVKRGGEGVLARTATGAVIEVPAIDVDVKNGLGAGDAFGGALCHGLVSGWELERALRFANAAGAIVASRMLCADDMPTEREVEALLAAA